MQIGYHTITWGGVYGHASGVTSFKDLFYVVPGPMDRALRDIAAAGYAGTEMFDGNLAEFEDRPDELRGLFRETGLELVSVYTGANFLYAEALDDELDRVRRACELARQFGARRLVVGGGARRASGTVDQDYERLAAGLDRVVDLADRHGLDATYHPHLGTIVEGPDELAGLIPLTRIGFCPDTAHLAAGGGDPETLIRRFGNRVRHVHLKDLSRETAEFVPLGDGDLDFEAILRAVLDIGYDDWLMIELDSYAGDPAEAAARSRDHLLGLLARLGVSVAAPS